MIEIIRKRAERLKYLERVDFYLEKIKEIARRHIFDVEIYLFGSYLASSNVPSSDIDVLIHAEKITEEQRTKILKEIYSELGYQHPFEIHIVDSKGFGWYKRFKMKKI